MKVSHSVVPERPYLGLQLHEQLGDIGENAHSGTR